MSGTSAGAPGTARPASRSPLFTLLFRCCSGASISFCLAAPPFHPLSSVLLLWLSLPLPSLLPPPASFGMPGFCFWQESAVAIPMAGAVSRQLVGRWSRGACGTPETGQCGRPAPSPGGTRTFWLEADRLHVTVGWPGLCGSGRRGRAGPCAAALPLCDPPHFGPLLSRMPHRAEGPGLARAAGPVPHDRATPGTGWSQDGHRAGAGLLPAGQHGRLAQPSSALGGASPSGHHRGGGRLELLPTALCSVESGLSQGARAFSGAKGSHVEAREDCGMCV